MVVAHEGSSPQVMIPVAFSIADWPLSALLQSLVFTPYSLEKGPRAQMVPSLHQLQSPLSIDRGMVLECRRGFGELPRTAIGLTFATVMHLHPIA